MEQIMNFPEYATHYPYIVVSNVDDEFWFYGAYWSSDQAFTCANLIDGIVVFNI